MPYVATKPLTAPRSTSKALGTFYFRVPYDRDAVDRTMVTFPDRIALADGKIPPTLFTPGPYTVVREIKGGAGGLSPQPFVVPDNPPATSSSPGSVPVTVNGSAVLAWDIYYLTDQNVIYPQPVVGAAQAARDAAQGYAEDAQEAAASVPSDVGAQLAARPTKTVADASYAPLDRAVPTGGSTAQVLTKTSGGFAWAAATGGAGGGLTITDNGSTLTLDATAGGSTSLTDNGSTVTITS